MEGQDQKQEVELNFKSQIIQNYIKIKLSRVWKIHWEIQDLILRIYRATNWKNKDRLKSNNFKFLVEYRNDPKIQMDSIKQRVFSTDSRRK